MALRKLRVLCTFHAMEGWIPDWKPGDHLHLFLSFNLGSPPVEDLLTTRRGFLERGELVEGGRTYGFHADGWNAQLYTPIPLPREVELSGYFTHSLHSSFDIPTYAVVTAVHRHEAGAIIDVTLDGATPRPLPAPTDGQVLCDDHILWILEPPLPYLRGFSLSTGEFIAQLSVPTWDPLIRIGDNLISDRSNCWRLPDLSPVVIANPEAPEGWETMRDFGNGLYSLIKTIEASTGDYSSTSLLQVAPPRLLDFDFGGYEVTAAYHFGNKIHVFTWKHHLVLTEDFRVLEVETKEDLPGMYTPIARATGLESGTVFGPYVVFAEHDGLVFHDQVTTEKITELPRPDKTWLEVAYASAERIVVALRRNTVQAIAVWETGQWNTIRLAR